MAKRNATQRNATQRENSADAVRIGLRRNPPIRGRVKIAIDISNVKNTHDLIIKERISGCLCVALVPILNH